jgi:hypothetical protein
MTPRIVTLEICVLTFKEGLLSRAAHDLKLSMGRTEAQISTDGTITVSVPVGAFKVEGVMEGGRLMPAALDAAQQADILGNLTRDVLRIAAYPTATFTGRALEQGDTAEFDGTLELCGVERPLRFKAYKQHGAFTAEFELKPSDFGIKPFRALFGAIRLQDRVRVLVREV